MERVNEGELQYRDGNSGVKYLFRGPRIDWGVVKFLPGQELGKHYHREVEETFYFVKGTPLMVVNDREFRVRTGDAFRLEPEDVHNIVNDTDGEVEAIFIKSSYNPKDKVDVA
ncbi:MAG: cupin domain-containing protein [bacterium]